MIHSDISGPFNESIGKKKYFLTILDEYSGKLKIFPLEKISQTSKTITMFFNNINNKFNEHRAMKFKTHGANEYKFKEIVDYCKEKEIYRINLPVNLHEMNWKAERFNQTIQYLVKTIMYWAGLSKNSRVLKYNMHVKHIIKFLIKEIII